MLFMVSRLIAVESAIQTLRTSKTEVSSKDGSFLENHIEQQSAELAAFSFDKCDGAGRRSTDGRSRAALQRNSSGCTRAHAKSGNERRNNRSLGRSSRTWKGRLPEMRKIVS